MKELRIVAGKYKGRIIKSPDSKSTHPMGSREKNALFNMIDPYILGNSVLDAFAGSGALGIEAISRGAELVVFLEKNHAAYQTIVENLTSIGEYGIRGIPKQGDVYQIMATAKDKFGIIIADPPYDKYNPEKLKVLVRALTDSNGILVLSHPEEAPAIPGVELIKTRQYARAHISIYIKQR